MDQFEQALEARAKYDSMLKEMSEDISRLDGTIAGEMITLLKEIVVPICKYLDAEIERHLWPG